MTVIDRTTATPSPSAFALVPRTPAGRLLAVAAASAALALAARLEIPLPFSPVPVTLQTFAVLALGALLGPRLGAAAVLLYICGGAAGLPVFAGATAGLTRLTGPTGGYLVGFVLAAAVVGALAERGWTTTVPRTVAAMLAGEVLIYAAGLAWLARFPLPVGMLEAGLYPFVVGDLYKLVLAALVASAATRRSQGQEHVAG